MSRTNNTHILFAACAAIFFIHQLLPASIAAIDNYLDPLLVMPVLLHLVCLERRWLLSRPEYELSAIHILGYFILVTIMAEIVFPSISPMHVADIWDVLFYALGALLYAAVKQLD